MSEILIGVLRMPPELFWADDELTRFQYDNIRREAADEIERLQAECERLNARVAELEPVEVVAVVTLGGIFHGGSGPELGDIDIEPSMSALEGIQLAAVHSDEDVHLDLMTVTQHERIVAAMAGQIDWQNITD